MIVAGSRTEAEAAINEITGGTLVSADAAQKLVIEEALTGTEVSVLVFSDGKNYALMPPARDHKRIGENDTGPNTGGMGAITDPSVLDPATLDQIVKEVVEPTLKGAASRGFPFPRNSFRRVDADSGWTESARVQRAVRRSGNAGDSGAAEF